MNSYHTCPDRLYQNGVSCTANVWPLGVRTPVIQYFGVQHSWTCDGMVRFSSGQTLVVTYKVLGWASAGATDGQAGSYCTIWLVLGTIGGRGAAEGNQIGLGRADLNPPGMSPPMRARRRSRRSHFQGVAEYEIAQPEPTPALHSHFAPSSQAHSAPSAPFQWQWKP